MARKFRLALFCITIVCSVTVLESCPKQTHFGAAKIDSNPGPFFQVPEWSFSPPNEAGVQRFEYLSKFKSYKT